MQLYKIQVNGINYQIRPSFLLPAMRAKTQEVSKPLFLLRFGVPFWALAFVFGRNPMWWYRMYLCLGRSSLVGTTMYETDNLPEDVLADVADGQHIRIQGQKAYVASTIGRGCMLGAEVCAKADEEKATGCFSRKLKIYERLISLKQSLLMGGQLRKMLGSIFFLK
ncbi:hypothetical protein [Tunicatimonas pelagia]|uniref:hypothetical protein n=1 Tax=Tunicatimonas pelagia TaxID=931531 RepID=UPI0026664AD4|nr:hypothetical protein [Tunicatimonas pelagia]WKN45088.1 hypothetical protein P0M28_08945 [Tunicatimonas pelagia]